MSDTYPNIVRRTLEALQSTDRAAVERQLPFTPAGDDVLEMMADAYILARQGLTADKISQVIRDRQIRDRWDMRASGRALDAATVLEPLPGRGIQHGDPALLLEASQEIEAALERGPGGWVTQTGTGLTYDEPELSVRAAAARCRRGLRSVQTAMRRRCRAEAVGQLVLPGMAPAGQVYSTRALAAAGGAR